MSARRRWSGSLCWAVCALLILPAVGNAGLFSSTPKTPPLLGSHPSSDAKGAREALLKERKKTVGNGSLKPGKTAVSQRQKPGKTLLGTAAKH